MSENMGKRPVVSSIQSYIVNAQNMTPISRSSTMRILKQKLGYRFKKLSKIERRSTQTSSQRKFFEAAMLQLKFENEGYEIIYFDEFSVSSRYNSFNGWSKKGQKGYMVVDYDAFSMFFIVAISSCRLYAIKGSTKPMDAEFIGTFLQEI